MELKKVESSNINAYGKDGEDLVVEFKKGTRYRYKGASKIWEELEAAPSKGSFISTNVKKNFICEKIEESIK